MTDATIVVEGATGNLGGRITRALPDAAINAGLPRLIPSDYSIDFTKLPPGENRNLDLRRHFHERLNRAAISATRIFNGASAELLTGGF